MTRQRFDCFWNIKAV